MRADARRLPFPPEVSTPLFRCAREGSACSAAATTLASSVQMAEAVKTGGRVAVSAFSAYFAVRHLEPGETFDAGEGVNHERAEVRDPEGRWPV